MAGQRRSQSYPERSSDQIELSGTQKAVRTQRATPAAPADGNSSNIAPTTNPVERLQSACFGILDRASYARDALHAAQL
ncbi:MAG TPA: hypothetical protein VGD41_10330 [Pyrinomonadaceae bacterium]